MQTTNKGIRNTLVTIMRPMTTKDIPQAAFLVLEAFGSKSEIKEPWTYETALMYIQTHFRPNKYSLVVEMSGTVVGICVASMDYFEGGPELYIWLFIVKGDLRNRGIGTRILNESIKFAKKNGAVSVCLLSHSGLNSKKIYKHWGFKNTGWEESRWKFDE